MIMNKLDFTTLLQESFKQHWQQPAFTNHYRNQTYSYGDAATQIARLHLLFKELKLAKGAKIALVGRNTPNWIVAYLATITYGAVIVPILQEFSADDIHHIVNHSDADILFCSDKIWDSLEEDKMGHLSAVFSTDDFRCIHQNDGCSIQKVLLALDNIFTKSYPKGFGPENVCYTARNDEDLMMINYTSGTTGFTKGVMISSRALSSNVRFGISTHLLENGDRALSFLPLAHTYGMLFDFLTACCVGAHTYLLNKIPSPKVLLKAFEEIRPTIIFTVPLILEKIYKKQIEPSISSMSMRLALSIPLIDSHIYQQINQSLTKAFGNEFKEVVIGGAPLNPVVEDFLRKIGFRFTVGYGMTECSPLIAYCNWEKFKPRSAGKILPGMEVKICSSDPQTIAGEILVKGPHVMSGYYKNEEATAQCLSADGWLKTGDIGIVDNEGYIYLKGRCKSMILGANGQNIYPEEIEEKLNNLPFVAESLIIESEGKLVALVYPDYEALDAGHINQADLQLLMEENRKQLNAHIAAYESISRIVLYPTAFEKTPKKNIKRYLYTDLVLS